MCALLVIPMLIGIGSVGNVRLIGWLSMVSTCLLPSMGIHYSPYSCPSQEYIFYQVYKKLGLSDKGILNHFTSPEFQVFISLDTLS